MGCAIAFPGGREFELTDGALFINGESREASSGRRFDVIDPSDESVVGSAADAALEDVAAAVGAARAAFDQTSWWLDHAFRRRCLVQLQTALRNQAASFKEMQVAEAGIPVGSLGHQVDGTTDGMSFDIDLIDSFDWETEFPPYERGGTRSLRGVTYEPYGVVAAITAWNAPYVLNLTKVIPALATGNTVVLKTAPETPLTGTMLADVVRDFTDIPPGVFNVVCSTDNSVGGDGLTGDRRVDMFHFTGSVAVGQRIFERAAAGIRKVVLELGGKSANLILDDADLDVALPYSARVCMGHSGQGCGVPSRLLVHGDLYDEVIARLEEIVRSVPWGDPRKPETVAGPIIRADQVDRIERLVDRAKAAGARVLVGGRRGNRNDKGFWYEPTLVTDVDENSELAQTEVFGPVLAVIRYDGDDDEAVRVANNSKYGLVGYIQSSDVERAVRIAKRIRAGTVNIGLSRCSSPSTPFGGYGMSGLGREHGVEGWKELLQSKTIATPAG
jgi:aldehyde dehydrogenase (NAD+)